LVAVVAAAEKTLPRVLAAAAAQVDLERVLD